MKQIFKQAWFVPILIILLALALRLPLLNGSFWLDEAAQALESSRSLAEQLNIIPDFQPPLLHLITHAAIQLSRAEWWLRLIGALIPGLITVFTTYKLGKKLFNRSVGILASILLTTSSFHIFYSQELRPYSLAAMWALLSWWLLTILVTTKDNSRPKNILWLVYALVSLLGLCSTYLYPFLILGQLIIIAIFYRSQLKHQCLSLCLTTLGFLPWLPTFLKQLQAGQTLRTTIPSWEAVVSLTQLKSLPLTLGKFVFGVINLEINLVFITISGLLLALTAILFFKSIKTGSKNTLLILTATLLPLLLAWLVSFWIPVVRPKRLLFLQPLLYLFWASLIQKQLALKQKFANNIAAILGASLLIINLWGTFQYYVQPKYQRENWREIYDQIQTRFPRNDTVVIFAFPSAFAPWHWYDQDHYHALATGKYYLTDKAELQLRLKPIFEYQYVLVFDYLRDLTDPDDLVIGVVEDYGYTLHEYLDQPNIGFVRVYLKDKNLLQAYN